MIFNFFVFVFIVLSCGFPQPLSVEVDGIAAVVGKEIILKSEGLQQAYIIGSSAGIDPRKNPQEFDALYIKTLDQLVDNLVLYDLSLTDTSIVLDEVLVQEYLDGEMKRRIDLAGSVFSLEKTFGEPLSMIRAKLRKDIKMSMQIEAFSSKIYQTTSPSIVDVRSFYKTNKDSLPFLDRRYSFSVLSWPVSVKKEKQDRALSFLFALKDSLALGQTFYGLAEKHSDDAGSSSRGGSLGFVSRGSLFPEYEAVAFSLEEGEVSEPFLSPVGFHLVLLEQRLGEKIKTSHILKSISVDEEDKSSSLESFRSFLGEKNVYNSVDTFDSLCVHFNSEKRGVDGVFYEVSEKNVPSFIANSFSYPLGFSDFLFYEGAWVLVRFWGQKEPEKMTLENSYKTLFSYAHNMLAFDVLSELINSHTEKIYIKKYY